MAENKEVPEVTRVTLEWLKGRNHTSDPLPFKKQFGTILFEGNFVFRRPDRLTEDAIAVRYGLLTSHWDADAGIYHRVPVADGDALFARAQAYLEYVIVSAPEWWNLDELHGFRDVVSDVFVDLFLPWVSSFRLPMETTQAGSTEATGSGPVANGALPSPPN